MIRDYRNHRIMKVQNSRNGEKGAALAIAIIVMAILTVISITALAFSASEARIAGSELRRTQSFYAASAGLEKMTHDFSEVFRRKMQPTASDIFTIENTPPPELVLENFEYIQTLEEDAEKLAKLRAIQGISSSFYPRVNIPEGPYAGLFASIVPYKLSSEATLKPSGAQVKVEREFNNYLVPLFQFAVFGNDDLEFAPGPFTTFNGRIHSNKNIYALRNTKFLSRVTAAGEIVRNSTRGGEANLSSGNNNVWMEVNGLNVNIDKGSVENGGGTVGGPFIVGSLVGQRGFHPGSPLGTANPNWETQSVLPADGTPGKFGGQLVSQSTGGAELKLPLQLEGGSAAELIKRSLPTDSFTMAGSRYEGKSVVRIMIDGETSGSGIANVPGIPAGKGVYLSDTAGSFNPIPLGGGNALRRVSDSGTFIDSTTINQATGSGNVNATVVRGVKSLGRTIGTDYIPPGAGIEGRILIEITKPDGTTLDVTQEILSMGMTVGEPNSIVNLQRPLWAAYVQGSRDRSGSNVELTNLVNNYQTAADGEIIAAPIFDPNGGFITGSVTALDEDGGTTTRQMTPAGAYNQIVPINVYNVREGWVRSQMDETTVWERGITNVVELNMKNLARWLDGKYDGNLLSGTNAVSANIKGDEGYVVYISDRRGDVTKQEKAPDGTVYNGTNGSVDNEDIYGADNILQPGEDAITTGYDYVLGADKANSLQKDTAELPDTGAPFTYAGPATPINAARMTRSDMVMRHQTAHFRRSVRLFNGESLITTGFVGSLSPTKGLTIATENMVYIWGNYNTTGVSSIPAGGSTLNDGVGYTGSQVPASIACDAIFPLSKTWFDGSSSLYPEGSSDARNRLGTVYRRADENLASVTQGTAVRAGILAGTNISSASGFPGRNTDGDRNNGGAINFPRFLEIWSLNGVEASWNYAGSFVPIFQSNQALSQWENDTSVIYMPPRRNWSFDLTFRNPSQIPPGTPFFQYVAATGFRQKIRE
jgi:hypothetical protein